jgi:hypothetical protein
LNSLYQSAKSSIPNVKHRVPLAWLEGWTIEDEQCQKIGGGYKGVKFRFLLFLWAEPTCYLRRSKVQRHWIGGAYDNLHGDRDLLQTLRCKRPSHSGNDGEDGSDAWIAIGIAGVLQGLLHVGLLPDRLKLFHLIRHLRRIASVLLFVAPGQKPLQVGSCAIMVYPP